MCIKSCSDQQIQSDIYCAVESLVNQVLIDKPSNNDEINKKGFLIKFEFFFAKMIFI